MYDALLMKRTERRRAEDNDEESQKLAEELLHSQEQPAAPAAMDADSERLVKELARKDEVRVLRLTLDS